MSLTVASRPTALEEPDLDQPLLHPGEDRAMRLHVDEAPRPRNRRVIGGRLMKRQAHETANRQRVGGPPRDAPLRIDAFEVPNTSNSRKYWPGGRLGRPITAA